MVENKIKTVKKSTEKKTVTPKKVTKKVAISKTPKVVKKSTEKKKATREKRKIFKKTNRSRGLSMKDYDLYEAHIKEVLRLEKHPSNPILYPDESIHWEKKGMLNPAALYDNGKIHLVYRAITHDDNSVLGYINSDDGINFDLSSKQLCYIHKKEPRTKKKKMKYASGGGGEGGCEDPRLIKIDDKVYLIYNAFNGWDSIRIAMSYISLEDFRSNRWNWSETIYLSPPNQRHKNWLLFPQKINNNFAIIHSISIKILIEYIDSFDYFDGDSFIHSIHDGSPLWALRNKLIRGVGPTPIWTPKGWLIFYHGMDPGQLDKYKIFAMILDLKDPTKIIAKSRHAVIEPEQVYEMTGIKPGIVYSCGTVVIDDTINVYYGASDNYICVATTNYTQFVDDLIKYSDVIIRKHTEVRNVNPF